MKTVYTTKAVCGSIIIHNTWPFINNVFLYISKSNVKQSNLVYIYETAMYNNNFSIHFVHHIEGIIFAYADDIFLKQVIKII